MEITFTLTDPATARAEDVTVRWTPGARWADVQADLPITATTWWADATPISPGHLLGVPPLVHGAVLLPHPEEAVIPGVVELAVISGPDAGRTVPLVPGQSLVIGRDPACDMMLGDAAISRRHARLELRHDGLTVTELSTTNPVLADGDEPVAPGTVIPAGAPLRLGGSEVVLRRPRGAAVGARNEDGHLLIEPRPHPPRAPAPAVLELPCPPPDQPRQRLPVALLIGPMIMGGTMAVMLRSPYVLIIGALSPLMMLFQLIAERRAGRTGSRRASTRYQAELAHHAQELEKAHRAETTARDREHPDIATCLQAARHRTELLWRGSGGTLRVGTGTAPSATLLGRPGEAPSPAPPLCRAPVLAELATAHTLQVTGDTGRRLATVRAILTRLAITHPPGSLSMDRHELTTWFPHTATRRGALHAALNRAPEDGEWALRWDDSTPSAAPGHLTLLRLGSDGDRLEDPAGRSWPLTADGITADLAEQAARALAPCRTAHRGTGEVPDAVPLVADPAGIITPDQVIARWRTPPAGLPVPLGADGQGDLTVDLVAHGPHALVGGTTGSGKSELLQSWVALLAVSHPPDQLSLVLVDYKGGAAFRACARLPHAAGLVTDLDAHEAARALTSLRAEIGRRERILAEIGAKDRDEAIAVDPAAASRIPRLVIVVDEFRALAEELPELVSGLVRIAALGRSLGVHLILATQRPAGVISAEIRANVSLRIALRMRDEADSRDVLDTADAAHLPAGQPGRFLVRHDAAAPRLAQCRYGGTPHQHDTAVAWIVRPGEPGRGDDEGPTQLSVLVDALCTAAERLGLPRPASPWPAPLPQAVEQAALPAGSSDAGLVIGVRDRPESQDLGPYRWSPGHDPHLVVIGAPRSGRSSALATIAQAALSRGWSIDALDATGALSALLRPDVDGRLGSFVTREHLELAEPLLDRLSTGQGPRLLLVDDLPSWLAELEPYDHGASAESLLRAVRDGPGTGLHVAFSGDRTVLTGRLSQLVPLRLGLRQADRADWSLLGIETRRAPERLPPGRVLLPGGGLAQLALPDAATPHPQTGSRLTPLPFPLTRLVDGCPAVAGGTARPVRPVSGSEELVAVITGGPRSGRSTALAAIGASLDRPVIGLTPGSRAPGSWAATAWDTVVTRGDAVALAAALTARPDAVVIADDLERLSGTDCEAVLLQRLAHARETACGGVIAAGSTADLAVTYRGLAAELRRERRGLVLMPRSPGDGEFFGLRLTPLRRPLPGRGYLIGDGAPVPLQMARLPVPAPEEPREPTGGTGQS